MAKAGVVILENAWTIAHRMPRTAAIQLRTHHPRSPMHRRTTRESELEPVDDDGIESFAAIASEHDALLTGHADNARSSPSFEDDHRQLACRSGLVVVEVADLVGLGPEQAIPF